MKIAAPKQQKQGKTTDERAALMNYNGNGKREKKRIVVATIDHTIEDTLGKQLDANELDVCFVRKGGELLLEILDRDINLLILDIDLADITGVEILPVIRRMRPRLPVILISDDYTNKIRKAAAEQGITYQATKPISKAEGSAILSATSRIIGKTSLVPVF